MASGAGRSSHSPVTGHRVAKPEAPTSCRANEKKRPASVTASTTFIVHLLYSSPAADAVAAMTRARTRPTWAATTATGSSVTRRQRHDRSCVLESVDAGGSALLVLRAGLHGHHSQHECSCSQSQCELSHQILLTALRGSQNWQNTTPTSGSIPDPMGALHPLYHQSPQAD